MDCQSSIATSRPSTPVSSTRLTIYHILVRHQAKWLCVNRKKQYVLQIIRLICLGFMLCLLPISEFKINLRRKKNVFNRSHFIKGVKLRGHVCLGCKASIRGPRSAKMQVCHHTQLKVITTEYTQVSHKTCYANVSNSLVLFMLSIMKVHGCLV